MQQAVAHERAARITKGRHWGTGGGSVSWPGWPVDALAELRSALQADEERRLSTTACGPVSKPMLSVTNVSSDAPAHAL